MSAAPRDNKKSSGKKRKLEDDETTSTGPAKKPKSNEAENTTPFVPVVSQAVDQNKVQRSSESKSRKPKSRPSNAQPEQAIKNEDYEPQTRKHAKVEKNTNAKEELRKETKAEKKKRKKAEKKAAKKAGQRPSKDERERAKIVDDSPIATPASSGKTLDEAEIQAKKQRAAAKKARRAAAKAQNGSSPLQLVQQNREVVEKAKKDAPSFHHWTLSPPSGGRFLDHDPIFVKDENGNDFLISANTREVQVLSLESSLVERTLPAPGGKSVVCYAVDALNDKIIRIGYSDNSIASWNWTKDLQQKEAFTVKGEIKALATATPARDVEKIGLFYLSKLPKQHAIFNADQGLLLYSTKQQLSTIQILDKGDYAISHGPSTLVLGMKNGPTATDFLWIEIPLTTPATCLDARLLPFNTGNEKAPGRRSGLRLAIGHSNGQIHLYDDVSPVFFLPGQVQTPDKNGSKNLPTPRILHWHREAVSSLKFSRDGNYLISGGKETVLVIWQLETGKKQFLPHLTSEIERIVVSPEGDRYALQMGDNSHVVLSTSELKAVALFAGLQQRCLMDEQGREMNGGGFVGTLHPRHPNQFLLAVPSSQPKSRRDITTRPFLQTFDLHHARHVGRQALTRNNVTDFNLGPERTPIIPPDVVHIAISADGGWLATVDEWMPPASDLEFLDVDPAGVERERERRREVYLKIWKWDGSEGQGLWTLSTRVDSPHARDDAYEGVGGAGRVLALVADPLSSGFVTVGEDRCVKLWTPRKRRRGRDDNAPVEWRCKWMVVLPKGGGEPEMLMEEGLESVEWRVEGASLAFSNDGSLVAVSLRNRNEVGPGGADEAPLVHFINTATGIISVSKSGLAMNGIECVEFLERYLVVASKPAVYVWDLVEDSLVYRISLDSSEGKYSKRPLLAIDLEERMFAVVVDGRAVQVHSPRQSKCLYKEEFEADVEGILSGKGRRGFVLVFADATIRTISPIGVSSEARWLPTAAREERLAPAVPSTTERALELDSAVEADDEMVDSIPSNKMLDYSEQLSTVRAQGEEDDRPVVRPEQLAKIFDVGPSFAMPPVKEMFHAVLGLFGRKPVQSAVSQA